MSQVFPRPADGRLIPMTFEGEGDHITARFTLGAGHARFDGGMYGGTGIAAAVIAMETATQRPALWVTIQFVSQPASREVVELAVDTLARGRRIAQVRVTATVGDAVAFVALGSTALARDGGLTGQYASMPEVSSPEDSAPQQRFSPANLAARATGMTMHEDSYVKRVELRDAAGGDNGRVLLWARLLDEPALTPAGVAFLADMVPVAIARAAGRAGAGVSLDNSMRFGPTGDTEWVLLELSGDVASGGYGHGTVRAWATDGTLLATGSQTANMIYVADD